MFSDRAKHALEKCARNHSPFLVFSFLSNDTGIPQRYKGTTWTIPHTGNLTFILIDPLDFQLTKSSSTE